MTIKSTIQLLIYILFLYILLFLFVNIKINFSNEAKITDKNQSHFKLIKFYEEEENNLKRAEEATLKCLRKYKSPEKRRGECFKFGIFLPSIKRNPYKEIYKYYKGGYNAIIEPSNQNNAEVIVAIPFAPPLIDGRIVARRSFMKEKVIDGLKTRYIFFTGLIPEKIYSYNFSFLKEEAIIFDDILVFDMINTYFNITLLLMSMHRWIIEKYSHIKYFIRCNLDAVFVPSRIKGLLHNGYDVISQIGLYPKWKIIYPQGFFYIFSIKMVKYIYNMSFKMKLHRYDDLFYGQIITNNKLIKIYDLKNQSEFFCVFCPLLYSKSFISLHSYTFSPAIIELIYHFTLSNLNAKYFYNSSKF